MKTATILKVLNPLLFVAVAIQLATVVAQKVTYADWLFEMHEIVGYSVFALVVLHLIFNWTWIKNNFFKKAKAKK
jgi:hypothetical protein